MAVTMTSTGGIAPELAEVIRALRDGDEEYLCCRAQTWVCQSQSVNLVQWLFCALKQLEVPANRTARGCFQYHVPGVGQLLWLRCGEFHVDSSLRLWATLDSMPLLSAKCEHNQPRFTIWSCKRPHRFSSDQIDRMIGHL